MTGALLGLLIGVAAGAVMTRGGLCFNRALRRAAFERRLTLLRAFAVAVAAQLVLLPALVALGVDPLVRAADTGGPPLLPVAQVTGGAVFGAGMALAGGCVTGMLWKAGAGSIRSPSPSSASLPASCSFAESRAGSSTRSTVRRGRRTTGSHSSRPSTTSRWR